MGDLRYGRTVHSLANALLHFDVNLTFIGPPSLRLPDDLRAHLEQRGRLGPEVDSLDEVEDLDVLYVTRIQRERFPDPLDYERVRHAYRLTRSAIERFGPDVKILHPLPPRERGGHGRGLASRRPLLRADPERRDGEDGPPAPAARGRGGRVVSGPKDFRLHEGTVIDHLPVGTALRALRLLRLPREGPVTVGINVPSTRFGRKDIVRVERLELSKTELDRLALLGQKLTVSIVQDGRVTDKIVLEVPRTVEGILRCPNPTCITNGEEVVTIFHRVGTWPYRFRCHHCERMTTANEV